MTINDEGYMSDMLDDLLLMAAQVRISLPVVSAELLKAAVQTARLAGVSTDAIHAAIDTSASALEASVDDARRPPH